MGYFQVSESAKVQLPSGGRGTSQSGVLRLTRDVSEGKALVTAMFLSKMRRRALRPTATSKLTELSYDTISTGCRSRWMARECGPRRLPGAARVAGKRARRKHTIAEKVVLTVD
ncbi:hypothetical protein [Paraburkholderia jirisanensis]